MTTATMGISRRSAPCTGTAMTKRSTRLVHIVAAVSLLTFVLEGPQDRSTQQSLVPACSAFAIRPFRQHQQQQHPRSYRPTSRSVHGSSSNQQRSSSASSILRWLAGSSSADDEVTFETAAETATSTVTSSLNTEYDDLLTKAVSDDPVLGDATTFQFHLEHHKPLGCTVDESLATYPNLLQGGGGKYVFVSKIAPGGNAARAGMQVGDVIVGVSDLFGTVTNVVHEGVERVKGYVASRPDDEPLVIRVARGTTVQQDHEQALVDLCSVDGSASDQEIEQCVLSFLQEGYNYQPTKNNAANDDEECLIDDDDDSNCLLENMHNMWAEDMPGGNDGSGTNGNSDMKGGDANFNDATANASKPKPWSSRSSPSGTYVRDPVTGEMKNIG